MDTKEFIPVFLGFCLYFINSYVGFSQYLQSGMILPLAIAACIIQQKIKAPPDIFRCEENGLWCSLLMLAISFFVEHEANVILRLITPLTLFYYVYMKFPCCEWSTPHYVAMVLLTLHTAFTSRIFSRDPYSILLVIVCTMIYLQLLHKIPTMFRNCFTYGELSILLQLYICEVYLTFLYFTGLLKMNTLEKLSVVAFLGIHAVVASFYTLNRCWCSLVYLWCTIVLLAVLFILSSLYYNFNIDEVYTLLYTVILTPTSIFLLTWWILWLALSVLLVGFHGNATSYKQSMQDVCSKSVQNLDLYDSSNGGDSGADDIMSYNQITPDSVSEDDDVQKKCVRVQYSSSRRQTFMLLRKYFHVAVLCVYIPGLMFSPSLLYIASIGAAAVLIILEAIRVMKIEPVGSVLDEYLCVFLDEQDQGNLILTPIYLLIGCSLPLWWNIKLSSIQCTVTIYSGLVSVGVGDAAASYFGRKYGRHKWPASKKSIEGTVAAFVSQILAILLLQISGISGAIVSMETTICVLLVSLLEAFTLQIDNLVIPIFSWMLLTSLQPTF